MKKIAVSLIALSALSTAAFAAGNRSWDLQDQQYYVTSGVLSAADSGSFAFAVPAGHMSYTNTDFGPGLSAFERTTLRSIDRDHGNR